MRGSLSTARVPDERQPVVGDRVEGVLVVDRVDDANDVGASDLIFELRVALLDSWKERRR